MKRTLQVFPDEFKLKVAREYMETEMSQVATITTNYLHIPPE